MNRKQFSGWVASVDFGKRLPSALYIVRLTDWRRIPLELAATVERASLAARPDDEWNLLKLHTDQVAITFLSYPDFDQNPHPALAESTKINLNTGAVVHTDYRQRVNPPILHRKETFLPPDDPRFALYQALTTAEEAAGLLKDKSRIGLRQAWLALLRHKRLGYDGHQLVSTQPEVEELAPDVTASPVEPVARHRTAIKRYDLSKPIKVAIDHSLLTPGQTVFDYGCGHGMDIEALKSLEYDAKGWDPAYRPDAPRCEADFVNLGYVLNVIEEPSERILVLKQAFNLAQRVLLVSTLVAGQETSAHSRPFRDGFLTSTNTFQKFYGPGELEELIERTLHREAITLALGICVVFRDPGEAEAFEAHRSRRKMDWTEIGHQLAFTSSSSRERRQVDRYALHQTLFDQFWAFLLEYGRLPASGEFDRLTELRKAAGGLQRAFKLAVNRNGVDLWKIAQATRKEDVLVYLAMLLFRRKVLRKEIPMRIREDLKAFFPDFPTAQTAARELLFSAGDPDELELAVESLKFGVLDEAERHYTFHRDRLDQLPAILRLYVFCGSLRYGNPKEADLIKIHLRSGKLTFLHYEQFERQRHPVLQMRIKINLRNQFPEIAHYILDNRSNYTFSALTVSIDSKVSFEPLAGQDKLGILQVPMDARFIINDGQHRRAAIIEALDQRPELAHETIAVVFFLDVGLERCQQMFADLNRYAIRPSRSLGLLYDHRNDKAKLAKLVVMKSEVFRDIVDMEKSSLARRSRKLFTLSAFYNSCADLVDGLATGDLPEDAKIARDYWEAVAEQFPQWGHVREGRTPASEVREGSIHSHGIALQALGKAGNALLKKHPRDWRKRLSAQGKIDWQRTNAQLWEGRAMIGGKVSKVTTNVILTTNVVKKALKLPLEPEEAKVEKAHAQGGRR